jgi:hypothetical protein
MMFNEDIVNMETFPMIATLAQKNMFSLFSWLASNAPCVGLPGLGGIIQFA